MGWQTKRLDVKPVVSRWTWIVTHWFQVAGGDLPTHGLVQKPDGQWIVTHWFSGCQGDLPKCGNAQNLGGQRIANHWFPGCRRLPNRTSTHCFPGCRRRPHQPMDAHRPAGGHAKTWFMGGNKATRPYHDCLVAVI